MAPPLPDLDRFRRLLDLWSKALPDPADQPPPLPLVPRLAAAADLLSLDAWTSLNLAGIPVTSGVLRTRAAKCFPPSPADPWPAPDPAARIKAPAPQDFLPGEVDPVVLAAVDGYLACQQEFKLTVMRMLQDGHPPATLLGDLPRWYEALMLPWSQAGLAQPLDIKQGRRRQATVFPVRHDPPAPRAVAPCLEILGARPDLARQPVLAHLALLWLQPWTAGNGRLARLAQSALMITGGHTWLFIPATSRAEYLAAVQTAFDYADPLPLVGLYKDPAP